MTNETKVTERAREFCYKLLSVCYRLPQPEWKGEVIIDELVEMLKVLDSNALQDAIKMREALQQKEDLLDLQVEYAKLFVGPYELLVPPYGSVYLENKRQVMGQTTVAAIDFYQKVGVDLLEDAKEVPDHIKIQLELMYYLAFKEGHAVRKEDFSAAKQYLLWQQQFIRDHLGKWVLSFADSLAKNAGEEFYQSLAKVTTILMKEEIERLTMDKCNH